MNRRIQLILLFLILLGTGVAYSAANYNGGVGSGWSGDNASTSNTASAPAYQLVFSPNSSGITTSSIYPGVSLGTITSGSLQAIIQDYNSATGTSTNAYSTAVLFSATSSNTVYNTSCSSGNTPPYSCCNASAAPSCSLGLTPSSSAIDISSYFLEKVGTGYSLAATSGTLTAASIGTFSIKSPVQLTVPASGAKWIQGVKDSTKLITWTDCRNGASPACANAKPLLTGTTTWGYDIEYQTSANGSTWPGSWSSVTALTSCQQGACANNTYNWAPPNSNFIRFRVKDSSADTEQTTYSSEYYGLPSTAVTATTLLSSRLNISSPSIGTTFQASTSFNDTVNIEVDLLANNVWSAVTGAVNPITLKLCDTSTAACNDISQCTTTGLTGTISNVSPASGIVSYTGIAINNAGSFKLCATDGAYLNAISSTTLTVTSVFGSPTPKLSNATGDTSSGAGQSFYVADSATITWTNGSGGALANVKLNYSIDGSSWTNITTVGSSPVGVNTYTWSSIPDNIDSSAYVQICKSDDTNCAASNSFKIEPKITVTGPASGQTWGVKDPGLTTGTQVTAPTCYTDAGNTSSNNTCASTPNNITWTYTGTVGSWTFEYATSENSYASYTSFTPSSAPTCASGTCTLNWKNVPDIISAVLGNPNPTPPTVSPYHTLGVKIRITDATHAAFVPTKLTEIITDKYYSIQWRIVTPAGSVLDNGVGVSETISGWSISATTGVLFSNVARFLRYYSYTAGYVTSWSYAGNNLTGADYPGGSATWTANADRTHTVTFYPIATNYLANSSLIYDAATGTTAINCWLVDNLGVVINNYAVSDTCTAKLYKADGSLVGTFTSSSAPASGSDGVFRIAPNLTGINTSSIYHGEVTITYNSATNKVYVDYNLAEPNLLNAINTTASTINTTVNTIAGQTATINWQDIGLIKSKTNTINWTAIDSIKAAVGADQTTTLYSKVTDILQDTSTDLPNTLKQTVRSKILNRSTMLNPGQTIRLRYKIDLTGLSGVTPTPLVVGYDPNNQIAIVSAAMTSDGATGIYYKDITFDAAWISGDYTLICSDAVTSSADSIVMTLLPSANVVNWQDVALIKSKTNTINWQDIGLLATSAGLTSAVAPLATSAGLTSAVAPLVTTAQLSTALAPLATSAGLTSAVAPLVTTAQLSTALAPLATSAGLTSAVAPLVTTAQLSTALAPLATSAGLTSAVAPLVTTAQLSTALAPLATSAGLTSAVAPLVTTAQLSTALAPLATSAGLTSAVAPLATSAGLTSAVAPLVTTAQLSTALAPLATSAGLTSAVAPLVTTAQLSTALAPLATSAGLTSAVAPLITSAQMTSLLAPLATSAGLTSAVAPLVTTAQLSTAVAPLATSAGLTSAVAPLATSAGLASAVAPLVTTAQLSAGLAPLATSAGLTSAVAPLVTSTQLIDQLEKGVLSKILNRESTATEGETISIQFLAKARAALATPPNISMQNPAAQNTNDFVYPAVPSTMTAGPTVGSDRQIFTATIRFPYVSSTPVSVTPNHTEIDGDYRITCSDPGAGSSNSVDSITIRVVPPSTVEDLAATLTSLDTTLDNISGVNWTSLSGLGDNLAPFTTTITDIKTDTGNLVTRLGTATSTDGSIGALVNTINTNMATSAGLTSAVAPLVTTAQLSTALAPLATSAGLTSAVAPLATSAGLTSAVAPLATSAGLTSAVAPLVTTAQLSTALAPLATSAGLTSAVAPLVTTTQLSTALAPLATSAGLTSAVANLVTTTQLSDALVPLATSAGVASAVAPLVTTAQLSAGLAPLATSAGLTSAVAPLATSAGLTSAVAPLVTTAQLSTALAPLATSAGLTNAVASLVTTAQLSTAIAPLATSAGLTSAVAPLVTTAQLSTAIAPLATSAGLTSAVASLVTTAQLSTAIAPLATSAGLTSAVAPLATSAGLTSAVAPLATSAGLTSAVAPLATNATVIATQNAVGNVLSLTNDVKTTVTASQTALANVQATVNTNQSNIGIIKDSVGTDLYTKLERLHSKILNRPTSVNTKATIDIRYQTDSGLTGAQAPVITVYDATQLSRISNASMTEIGSTGIYRYAVTFDELWGKGDFTILCSEPSTSRKDSMIINVGTASDLTNIASKLDDLEDAITTISTNVSSIKTVIGTTADTSSSNTLFGKLSGVSTNASTLMSQWDNFGATEIVDSIEAMESYMGTPNDSGQMLTVFGKIAQVSDQTGTVPIATSIASQAYTDLQNLRNEIGASGKTKKAYAIMEEVNSVIGELQKSIATMAEQTADVRMKDIAEAVNETRVILKKTVSSIGMQNMMQEKDSTATSFQGLQKQIGDLKVVVSSIKKSIEQGQGAVVKTWLEKSNQ